MPAQTNTVSISVLDVLDVISASLSADKTEVVVGDTVNFIIQATLNRVPTQYELQYYSIAADIYVNGVKQTTVTQPLSQGETLSFSLQFNQAGTYDVYAVVMVGPGV